MRFSVECVVFFNCRFRPRDTQSTVIRPIVTDRRINYIYADMTGHELPASEWADSSHKSVRIAEISYVRTRNYAIIVAIIHIICLAANTKVDLSLDMIIRVTCVGGD